ncbi:MAG: PilT/PilU family type 4a pilus ATPase [Candidatus Rokubacteria bacterium]|nr:PilT/PilU family type 4a pilus ATPase [Candidatus Rokubacteria bacterium]
MELAQILREGMNRGASDFHLKPKQHAVLRVQGKLMPIDSWPPVEPKDLEQMAQAMMTPPQRDRYEREGGVDVQYSVAGVGRFRASICKARGSTSIALRTVPYELPSFDDLNLPPVVAKLAMEPRGLVLVTGPAGSGKTTTLAAMIHHMNQHRNDHIVMIEDPIEYLHQDKNCIITQREVGTDTPSFADALRICLRQDPDVIMVGEMRDVETIHTVLTLAETGHLVLSTLHTITAAETVNRIIAEFPGSHERQIRGQLAQVLKGIISQRLIERADGSGLLPAVEVLVSTSTIQRCIEDPARTAQIPQAIAEGKEMYGMQTFDQCVLAHYQKGTITYEEALRASSSPTDLEVEVQRLSMSAPAAAKPGAGGPSVGRTAGRPPGR